MTMSEKWIPEIMTPLKQDIVKNARDYSASQWH